MQTIIPLIVIVPYPTVENVVRSGQPLRMCEVLKVLARVANEILTIYTDSVLYQPTHVWYLILNARNSYFLTLLRWVFSILLDWCITNRVVIQIRRWKLSEVRILTSLMVSSYCNFFLSQVYSSQLHSDDVSFSKKSDGCDLILFNAPYLHGHGIVSWIIALAVLM